VSPRRRITDDEVAGHVQQLVEATFRVAAATGNAAPPVRPILEEAGLSRHVFYRCFESLDDLRVAVLTEGCRQLAGYLEARIRRAQRPDGKVRAWITGVMRQAQASTERTRPFIVAPPVWRSGRYQQETEGLFASMLAEVITQGVAEGIWGSTDPMGDALIIHDFVFNSMRRHLFSDERPSRATVERLCDFALNGLSAACFPGPDDEVWTEARVRNAKP
jgi:AcrR family transcriptional regulator